jgi:hypothetical protein
MLKFIFSATAFGETVTVIRPSALEIIPPSGPMLFVTREPFGVPTGVGLFAALEEFALEVEALLNHKPATIATTTTTTATIAKAEIVNPMNSFFRDMADSSPAP